VQSRERKDKPGARRLVFLCRTAEKGEFQSTTGAWGAVAAALQREMAVTRSNPDSNTRLGADLGSTAKEVVWGCMARRNSKRSPEDKAMLRKIIGEARNAGGEEKGNLPGESRTCIQSVPALRPAV